MLVSLPDRELRARRCPTKPRVIRSVPNPPVKDGQTGAHSAKPKGLVQRGIRARCYVQLHRTVHRAPPLRATPGTARLQPQRGRMRIDRRPQRAFDRTFQAATRTRRTVSLAQRRSFRIPPKGTAQPTGFPKETGLHKAPSRAVRCACSKRRSARSVVQPTVTSWRWALAAEAAVASTPSHGVHRRNDGPSVEARITRRRNGSCRLPQVAGFASRPQNLCADRRSGPCLGPVNFR